MHPSSENNRMAEFHKLFRSEIFVDDKYPSREKTLQGITLADYSMFVITIICSDCYIYTKHLPFVSFAENAWTATTSPGTPTAPSSKSPSNFALGCTPR